MISIKENKLHPVLMLWILMLLLACTPTLVTTESSGTATSLHSAILPTATQLPTVAVDTIESLVANPSYLKGCRELNPIIYTEQATYLGIAPGKTTSLEVKGLVGEPKEVFLGAWQYDGYDIEFEKDVVSQIFTRGYPDPLPSVSEIVETYGCPDVIFAYHLSVDEPSLETPGTLDMVSFVYCRIGFKFEIYHYPVRLADNVEIGYYFAPTSLHDYIYDTSFREALLESADAIKPVSWDEAVIE